MHSDLKKKKIMNSKNFGIQVWRKKHVNYDKFEIAKIKYLTQKNFFFLLTGANLYYHVSYIVASFTGYEDDIFEVISDLHIQDSKFDRKIYKFGE